MQAHRITVNRTARYLTLGDGGPIDDVWFVLHGYSQLARHFIRWFEPAQRPGRLIVAPEALSRSYYEAKGGIRRVGASWMTKEDRDAEIADYVAYLDRVAGEVVGRLGGRSDTVRVQIHGFSQGGATAARWAALGHRPFGRLVFWGSTLPPDLDIELLRPRLRDEPVTIVVGDRDHYIAADQVQAELARLAELRLSVRFLPFAGGHMVDRETLERLAQETPSA